MSKKDSKEVVDVDTALDELNDLSNGDGVEINGRVYRINSPKDCIGRPTFEAVAKVSEIVDEDWIGRNFGGGQYRIKYTINDGTQKAIKQVNYNIGHEYDKFLNNNMLSPNAQAPAKESAIGLPNIGGFLGSLTVEKITAIGAAVKMFRDLIAPPPPPQMDFTKVLEIIAASTQKNSVSDAIVIESLKSMKQQAAAPQNSISQVLNEYKNIKEILDEQKDEKEDGDDMSFLLEQAFKYLPLLLKKNNNDYRAVGVEAANNPMIQSVINSNEELAKKFFEVAAEKYGEENANKLAAGFGYATPIIRHEVSEVNTNEP